jgi:hypothetical protein
MTRRKNPAAGCIVIHSTLYLIHASRIPFGAAPIHLPLSVSFKLIGWYFLESPTIVLNLRRDVYRNTTPPLLFPLGVAMAKMILLSYLFAVESPREGDTAFIATEL